MKKIFTLPSKIIKVLAYFLMECCGAFRNVIVMFIQYGRMGR